VLLKIVYLLRAACSVWPSCAPVPTLPGITTLAGLPADG
jgi:hypothetical protein